MDIISEYKMKLEEILASATRLSDPVGKERRCYPLEPDPVLRLPILRFAYRQSMLDDDYSVEGGGVGPTYWDTEREVSAAYAYYSQSLKGKYLDTRLLPIKLSSKTILDEEAHRSLRDNVERSVRKLTTPHDNPWLSDVTEDLGQDTPSLEWTEDGPPEFFQDILEIIKKHPTSSVYFASDIDEFRKKHYRPCTLELKTKYYPARADHRAYYVDTNVRRALSGAALQAILSPKLVIDYGEKPYARIYPKKGKNLMHSGRLHRLAYSYLGTGDLSSFTASSLNFWLSLVLKILVVREWEDKGETPFALVLDGWLIETTLCEILLSYLYECIFATVHYQDFEYYTMGGYLGVPGNMTVSCVAFAYSMLRLFDTLGWYYDCEIEGRIGGDDFYVYLTSRREVAHDIWIDILDYLSRHLGNLKGPVLRFIPREVGVYELDLRYCKKRVLADVSTDTQGQSLHLRSIHGFPVMEHLLVDPPHDTPKWTSEFVEGVHSATSNVSHPCPELFMCELFKSIHPSVDLPARRITLDIVKKECLPPVIHDVDVVYSINLIELLGLGCRPLRDGFVVRQSLRSQLDYLVVREKARQLTGVPDDRRVWYLTPSEYNEAVARDIRFLGLPNIEVDKESVEECKKIIDNIRKHL